MCMLSLTLEEVIINMYLGTNNDVHNTKAVALVPAALVIYAAIIAAK